MQSIAVKTLNPSTIPLETSYDTRAGIMALPNAFRVLGVLGGCLALVVMHGVTHITLNFILRATAASGTKTFAALTRHYLGPTWKFLLQVTLNPKP